MTELTQDILKELLHYDPSTGIFTWRVYRGPNAKVGDTAGCIDKDGYRKIKINFRSYWEHRLAFLYMSGTHPNATVDHINGNRSDNRFENVMRLTKAQLRMLENASRGIVPYHPKSLTGGAMKNLRKLQDEGLLEGHKLTDAGRAALAQSEEKK